MDSGQRTGLADYRATPGNRGVFVLRRVEGDVAHFVLTTLWDSGKYAGFQKDPEKQIQAAPGGKPNVTWGAFCW